MDNYKDLQKKDEIIINHEGNDYIEDELDQNLNINQELERIVQKEKAKEAIPQQMEDQEIEDQKEIENPLEDAIVNLEEKREEVADLVQKNVPHISASKKYKKNKRQLDGAKRYRQKKERKREREVKREWDDTVKREAEGRLNKTLFDQYTEEEEIRIAAYSPDLDKMRSEHSVVMEYTLKKKNIIKPNEYEYKAKVTDKDSKVDEKRRNAKRLIADLDMVTDKSIRARRDVPMDLKKKFDYRTFSDLNDVTQYMNAQDGTLVMKLLGEYNTFDKGYETRKKKDPENAEKVRRYDKETRLYPAMDLMADHIMKIDHFSLDMSDDTTLVKNAIRLEEMSKSVQGFTKMLQQHPDYLDHLMQRKVRKEENGKEEATEVSFAERLMKRMDLLTAMSDYYRVRRLIIEDETYSQYANEEISYEETDADTPQMKRVKRLLRSSFYLAQNLSKELGGRYGVPQGFKDAAEGTLLRNQIHYNVADEPEYIALSKQAKDTGDQKDQKALLAFKEKFPAKRDQAIKKRLQEYGQQSRQMYELENSRYFIAPLWMRGALSIDPDRQVTKKEPGVDSYYSLGDTFTDIRMCNWNMKQRGKTKLNARFLKMGRDKTGVSWGDAPTFDGGRDKILAKLDISDNWDRVFHSMVTEYAYRRTDDEIMEMVDYLSVQKGNKWKQINDQEEIDFYESAYKEMSLKLLSMEYASVVRQSESIGMESLLLHPVDFMMQMTGKLRSVVFANAIITNVDTRENVPRIDQLFKENNTDGRYEFDTKKFKAHAAMVASMNLRLQNVASAMISLTTDMEKEEECEAMFGDGRFYDHVIQVEWERMKAQGDQEALAMQDNEMNHIASWFFSRHLEYFTPKYLNKRHGGRSILGDEIQTAYRMSLSENEENMRYAIKNRLVTHYDQTQIDAYEESLRKRGFAKVRFREANDNPNANVEYHSRDGKAGCSLHMSDIIRNREADPYGIKMIQSGFEELVFKNNEGVEYVRSGFNQM